MLVLISIGDFAVAQQAVEKTDSISATIESDTDQSKFTTFIYRYFYKRASHETKKYRAKRIGYKKLIQKPYSAFDGKIIRHISIETLDPFDNSIADTIEVPRNFISRNGNNYHIKSKDATIRNQLLIKENQPFDSLLITESERMVRSNEYIRDVSFSVKSPSEISDSVDVIIRALDIWSIIPIASISAPRSYLSLTENNFLGLGHVFQNALSLNAAGQDNLFQTSYFIPTISNTFISGTFNYQMVGNHYSNRSIAFNRSFFSPLTKWAAGAVFMQQFHNDSIRITFSDVVPLRFKNSTHDYWAGYAMKLSKGNSEYERATNFVSSVRFLRIRYTEKPTKEADQLHFYTNENFYMASVGISTRKYVQDKYNFKYGITEDVPIGKVFSLTGGYQQKNTIGRYYLSARFSLGNYYSWGYLSTNIEYGTFFNALQTEQSAVRADAFYFTGLIEVGKWRFRQFIKPQITFSINGLSSDSLLLNEGYGLDGFKNATVSGTRRLLLTLQTQSYAPWNFIGFRFGPFMTYSLGMLGNTETGFSRSKIYSQIGVGVLIKNENLILNTFQLAISFYPLIPG
ncbi:MAG: hypothetical protein PF541_03520, partial [Prolixibacteraceae bacterium]|nr:hypothetical protein [Prolixibacteraceae bacterium]